MMANQDKMMARRAAVMFFAGAALVVLLVLDLLNRGLIWRTFQAFRSEHNSTLPNETRTVGESYRAKIRFLS